MLKQQKLDKETGQRETWPGQNPSRVMQKEKSNCQNICCVCDHLDELLTERCPLFLFSKQLLQNKMHSYQPVIMLLIMGRSDHIE